MGVPCTSHMENRVMLLATGFPFLHSINTRKPRPVPHRMDSRVISIVVPTPSRNSFQRFSRIKVLLKLDKIPPQKVSVFASEATVSVPSPSRVSRPEAAVPSSFITTSTVPPE